MNKLLIISVAVVAATCQASVFDDAKVWFRGGYDANGDGAFSAGEFVDSARPKSDAAHQTVTLTGGGAAYGCGDVWSAYNPLYTNQQYYVSLTNGDCAASADCTTIKIVNPLASGESLSQFTIFVRFRWDGKFAPGSADKFYIVDTGQVWSGQRCFKFGFEYFSATDDFAPCWEIGARSDGRNPSATSGIKLPVGEWCDFMITVIDRGLDKTSTIMVYRGEKGTASVCASQSPWLAAWQQNAQRANRVGLEASDPVTLGDATFSGDIAAWALWPKVLSEDEMREAFADPRPGDALFRIGKEDGKSDEFAAAGQAQYAVDAGGTWDVVPTALDGTHDTLAISFDVPASWDYLNQVLRLVAVSGDGEVEGVVADAVRGTSTTLRARRLAAGHPADFFIPGEFLRTGPHTLTLKLSQGSGVVFDVIEMRGSFCLGNIDYNLAKNQQFYETSGQTYYDVATGYWPAMDGNIWPDTIHDPEAANYDPDSVAATTVFFDVPADLVGCTNWLHVSYNNFQARPDAIYAYLNDSLLYESDSEYQYKVVALQLPPDTLAAGRNTFRLRRVHSTSWWGNIRGFRIQIQNGPPREPTAFSIVVR